MSIDAQQSLRPIRGLRRIPFRLQLLGVALLSVVGVSTATAITPSASATYQTYSCASCRAVWGTPDWVSNAMATDYTSSPYSVCTEVVGVGAVCNTHWYTAIYCAGFQTNNVYGEAYTDGALTDHLSGHADNYATCG